jgi:adenylyltransferase/sulfurtransferase
LTHLIGKGETLDGSMLFSDALDMEFDKVEIPKQDDCPVCGDDPAIESVHDVEYTASCAIDAGGDAEPEIEAIE